MPSNSSKSQEPFLQRFGVAYLERLSRGCPVPECSDEVHVLNPTEQALLRRIERGVIVRAATAGACSATLAALADVLVSSGRLFPVAAQAGLPATLPGWLFIGSVTLLAATFEILFIYRDALRSVHALALAAGLRPLETPPVAAALVRAALEMPNPVQPIWGVNPLREISKLRILAASLLYKAKIGLTNFLLKTLIRRILGRAVVRVWLAFVAVPISAVWNAIVAFRVIREARIRAMGPSFVTETVSRLLDREGLSPAARRVALRAVAGAIVRSHDLHPNLTCLLAAVRTRVGAETPEDLDDSARFVAELGQLPRADQPIVLELLAIAAVIDGRLTGAERRLVRDARAACGLSTSLEALYRLRRAFISGQPQVT
jgi:hypothetical protein